MRCDCSKATHDTTSVVVEWRIHAIACIPLRRVIFTEVKHLIALQNFSLVHVISLHSHTMIHLSYVSVPHRIAAKCAMLELLMVLHVEQIRVLTHLRIVSMKGSSRVSTSILG